MGRTFKIVEDKHPDLAYLMLATVTALRDLGGSANIQELDDQVIESEGISEDEQAIMLPNGKYRKLNYYLAWARTYLRRGDAAENSKRGVWALTDEGERIRSIDQTRQIYARVQREERERSKRKREAKRDKKSKVSDLDLSP